MHQLSLPWKPWMLKKSEARRSWSLSRLWLPMSAAPGECLGPFKKRCTKCRPYLQRSPNTELHGAWEAVILATSKVWDTLMTGIQRFCPSHDISFLTHSDPLGHSPIVNTSPSRKFEFSWVFNMHKETRSSNSIPFLWHGIVSNTPRGTTPLRLPNLFSGFILNKDNDMQTCHVMNALCKARNAKQEPPQNIS